MHSDILGVHLLLVDSSKYVVLLRTLHRNLAFQVPLSRDVQSPNELANHLWNKKSNIILNEETAYFAQFAIIIIY